MTKCKTCNDTRTVAGRRGYPGTHAARVQEPCPDCAASKSEETRMSTDQQHKTALAVQMVEAERTRQHEKWGEQRHGMPVWLTVLMEEVGEVSQAVLYLRSQPPVHKAHRQRHLEALRGEVVQVAAVALAMLEHLNDAIADGDGLPGEVWQ